MSLAWETSKKRVPLCGLVKGYHCLRVTDVPGEPLWDSVAGPDLRQIVYYRTISRGTLDNWSCEGRLCLLYDVPCFLGNFLSSLESFFSVMWKGVKKSVFHWDGLVIHELKLDLFVVFLVFLRRANYFKRWIDSSFAFLCLCTKQIFDVHRNGVWMFCNNLSLTITDYSTLSQFYLSALAASLPTIGMEAHALLQTSNPSPSSIFQPWLTVSHQ
jgi:hypothetical protein